MPDARSAKLTLDSFCSAKEDWLICRQAKDLRCNLSQADSSEMPMTISAKLVTDVLIGISVDEEPLCLQKATAKSHFLCYDVFYLAKEG